MTDNAPYAEVAIALSLGSITGLKYREYCCMECGNTIIERNNDRIILYSSHVPTEARTDIDGNIPTICDRCQQKYLVTVSSQEIQNPFNNLPLYMQPQAVFVAVEPTKKLRDIHCLECGHSFYSLSDRVNMIADNVIPFESLDPARLGPMEAHCRFHHCKQRWSVMA